MATKRKKPSWAKRLTKKDLAHLAESSDTGRASLAFLKRQLKDSPQSCLECRSIGHRAGLSFDSLQIP